MTYRIDADKNKKPLKNRIVAKTLVALLVMAAPSVVEAMLRAELGRLVPGMTPSGNWHNDWAATAGSTTAEQIFGSSRLAQLDILRFNIDAERDTGLNKLVITEQRFPSLFSVECVRYRAMGSALPRVAYDVVLHHARLGMAHIALANSFEITGECSRLWRLAITWPKNPVMLDSQLLPALAELTIAGTAEGRFAFQHSFESVLTLRVNVRTYNESITPDHLPGLFPHLKRVDFLKEGTTDLADGISITGAEELETILLPSGVGTAFLEKLAIRNCPKLKYIEYSDRLDVENCTFNTTELPSDDMRKITIENCPALMQH